MCTKNKLHSSLLFLRYCKDFANLLFWVIWAGLAMPTRINYITSWNIFIFICMQKMNFISTFFFEILQRYYKLPIGYFGHVWLWPVKTRILPCRKFWCLSSCKKSYLSLIFFLKYYRDIANLVFWVLWECLVAPTKGNSTNLQETLMPIYKQKINLIVNFLEVLHFKESSNLIGQEHFR